MLDDWGINKIPHIILIDQNGKIAYRGKPGARANVYLDVKSLLKGENKLVDTQTPKEEMKYNLEGFSDIDAQTSQIIMKEMDIFNAITS